MADPPDFDQNVAAGYPDGEPPRRRRLPGIVFAVAIGIMAAAGLWLGQRLTGPGAAPATVPILHADTRPLKVQPSQRGGMEVPDQDKIVLNQGHTPASDVEQLLPPPETPLPRPVPESPAPASDRNPAAPQQQPAIATAASAPPQPSIPVPASASPQPATVVAASAPPPASAAAASAVPPADRAAAPRSDAPGSGAAKVQASSEPAAPAAGPAVAASGGYRLQLGAVRSDEAAQKEWERLKRAHADLLGSLSFSAWRVELGERGVYYRIMAGPIADAAEAERVCADLKARKLGCILVKP